MTALSPLQGGALVDVGPLRGFVPLSKMDPARLPRNAQNGANGGAGSNGLTPKDLAHLVGKPIAAKVIQARSQGPACIHVLLIDVCCACFLNKPAHRSSAMYWVITQPHDV